MATGIVCQGCPVTLFFFHFVIESLLEAVFLISPGSDVELLLRGTVSELEGANDL